MDAHRGLQHNLWACHPRVSPACYAPGPEPYFLSIDNAPVHSFWLDDKKKKHVHNTGVSLLQLLPIAPKAHDQHLVIEHGIGTTKCTANKSVQELVKEGVEVGVSELYESVQEAFQKVDGKYVDKALHRLRNVLEVVGSGKGVKLSLVMGDGRVMETYGTGGGYPSQELY